VPIGIGGCCRRARGIAAYLMAGMPREQINSLAGAAVREREPQRRHGILTTGSSESLINSLAQLPGALERQRSVAFPYKGPDFEAEGDGELNVSAVITGRVTTRATC